MFAENTLSFRYKGRPPNVCVWES